MHRAHPSPGLLRDASSVTRNQERSGNSVRSQGMSHPQHLEPLPSWKEKKGERGDPTSPHRGARVCVCVCVCVCVTSWGPGGKGGCQETIGGPGDPFSLLCSFQPLLCESQTFVLHPSSLSFPTSTSPISHSFIAMTTTPLDFTAERPPTTPLDFTAERPRLTLNFRPLSHHPRPS